MPKKQTGRVATADRIATLLRIYRSAVRSGDESLRRASANELRTKYRIDVADLLADQSPELSDEGVNRG